jgi:hypothetical protein
VQEERDFHGVEPRDGARFRDRIGARRRQSDRRPDRQGARRRQEDLGADRHLHSEGHDLLIGRDRRAAPSATIYAKWTYQDGQTVKTDSRAIAPTGPAVTEFSIQKPEGWPKGGYKVDISVDGQAAASSKSFRVE